MRLPWHAWLRFLTMLTLILGPAIVFTGFQLAGVWPPQAPQRWLAWGLTVLLWVYPVTRMLFFRERRASWAQSLGFVLMGLAATTFMLLLALKLAAWALGFAGLAWPRWAPWWALGVGALLSAWGWRSAFAPARLTRHTLKVPGLHPGLQGLKIVQISDLHVSHLVGRDKVAQLVEQVQALRPDLIAITGDLVDGPRRDLAEAVHPLAGLKAPLGVHYVTGNHEYYWGVDDWLEEFAGLGFELLTNAHRDLEHQGAKLLVLGVNDPSAHQFGDDGQDELLKARLGASPADFTLFLAHQPKAYAMAAAAEAQLFLAGHTHGGQFFPFSLLIGLFHRYAKGLHLHEGRLWVYIHTGSGFWGPPNRLGVPPEIALLELSA